MVEFVVAESLLQQRATRLLPRAAVLGVVLGLALAACSAGDFDPDSPGAQILTDLSPLEVDVLRDKDVSDFDIIITNSALSDCLLEAGAEDVFVDNASASYSISGEPSPEFESAADECQEEVDAIAAVWFMQNDDTIFETPLPGLEAALERLDVDG